jgi:putative spermidine/putrescine transport system substrate-binding protein
MSKKSGLPPKSASKSFVTDRRVGMNSGATRRSFLKAGGALLGGAAGAGAITGFPTIWAQEIKDIELRHVGVSYSVVKAIGDQARRAARH